MTSRPGPRFGVSLSVGSQDSAYTAARRQLLESSQPTSTEISAIPHRRWTPPRGSSARTTVASIVWFGAQVDETIAFYQALGLPLKR